MILAGDIGGTKTALGLYREGPVLEDPVAKEIFSSQEHGSLEEITALFLERIRPAPIGSASFAVAGPIISGTASVTNLAWTVQAASLETALGVKKVRLINDVQAIACSVPVLGEKDLCTLRTGTAAAGGTIAVIAAGTGLGEAFLTWEGASYRSYPTEGGHSDFGPADERQAGLLSFMRRRRSHVSWEIVCSGIGIPNIYDYLSGTGDYENCSHGREESGDVMDRTPVIIGAALGSSSSCALCAATLDTFVSMLGAESGNLVLKTMATGGLYLGGGIPPRILEALEAGPFMDAFTSKGRLSPMMERVPVHVILNPDAALTGAAMEGIRICGKEIP